MRGWASKVMRRRSVFKKRAFEKQFSSFVFAASRTRGIRGIENGPQGLYYSPQGLYYSPQALSGSHVQVFIPESDERRVLV